MYRLLAIAGENRERRRQRTHPARKKPQLIATAPNQVFLGHHETARPATRYPLTSHEHHNPGDVLQNRPVSPVYATSHNSSANPRKRCTWLE